MSTARLGIRSYAHTLELMRRFPESEWGWVLREIERHQRELDARQTSEQAEWTQAAVRRHRVNTGRAAQTVISAL